MLPIVDVALAGIDRMVQRLPRLLAIYWLPWLLGTVAILTLEVVVQDQLRLGWAPDWARSIVWAPFAAMAYLMLLRWVLDGDPPARAINLYVAGEIWFTAVVIAVWSVASVAVSDAPVRILRWLVLPTDDFEFRWEDVSVYYYVFWLAACLVNSALLACFFGLIVVVTKYGWPDLRECSRLLRLQPKGLLCISLLATAAAGGADKLASQALAWLRVSQLAPQGMIPWRANIHWAFIAELPYFLSHFLEFAIQGCILAEAYRRLVSTTQ